MPAIYVLSVGVDAQRPPDAVAWDAYAQDATLVQAAVVGASTLYPQVHCRVLTGAHATRAKVFAGLRWLAEHVQRDDVALLFFSAHGEWDARAGYLMHLAPDRPPTPAVLGGHELLAALAPLRGTTLVLLDTCHAAGLLTPALHPLPASFLLACHATEASYGQTPRRNRPHGYIVQAFSEALAGRAARTAQGLVTVQAVGEYLTLRIPLLCPHQTPVAAIRADSAAVGLVRIAPTSQRRHPFGQPAAVAPDGPEVATFAATVRLNGDRRDANARAWQTLTTRRDDDGLLGHWDSRWKRTASRTWQVGRAEIKRCGQRVSILYRDAGSAYLIEARTVGPDRLVGRYVNLGEETDTSPWVGRIVNPDRIDGQWNGGRWDLRRGAT